MRQAADWTEPGAFEVAPGVHRIPLPLPHDGLRAVNVYAVLGADQLVLVDAGWALAESRRSLEAALGALGCGLGDVTRFLITHVHRDHYTQAVALRREFGARVTLGAGEQPALEAINRPARQTLEVQLRLLTACGAHALVERLRAAGHEHETDTTDWEFPDDWLDAPATLQLAGRQLEAIPTPGHTRGHVVFADGAAGLLFAGDHVLPHITPSIGFEPVPAESPLGDYLQSLARVRALPDLRLLPAHGPVAVSVHARVDELLAHHDERLAACETAVAAGTGTAYETARALRWTRRGRSFDELDLFNQLLATAETAAHLQVLVSADRLTRATVEGGVLHFQPTADS